ncbi:MAG: hypothetical protein GY827_12765 [Cytophagales bacterium]|nr:hypothetical protein [Cytophagales bacterium]
MSIEAEIARLEVICLDFEMPQEQRDAASQAIDKLCENQINEAWKQIEESGTELQNLSTQLSDLVTKIENNENITETMNNVTTLVTEATETINSIENADT